MPESLRSPVSESLGTIGLVVLLLAVGPLGEPRAQERGRSPSARSPASSPQDPGAVPGRPQSGRSEPSVPGTGLPPAARSFDPPAIRDGSPRGTPSPQGRAKTSNPDMPGSMPQAPIGGAEWLAAAGAAYALNRLRKEDESEDDA